VGNQRATRKILLRRGRESSGSEGSHDNVHGKRRAKNGPPLKGTGGGERAGRPVLSKPCSALKLVRDC